MVDNPRCQHSPLHPGFFPGGEPGGNKFAHPPNRPPSSLFDQSLFPQLSFVPKNFKKITSFFSQFSTTFSLKTALGSSILCLKHKKNCSNFAVGGIFASEDNFSKAPYLTSSPTHVPHLTQSPTVTENRP